MQYPPSLASNGAPIDGHRGRLWHALDWYHRHCHGICYWTCLVLWLAFGVMLYESYVSPNIIGEFVRYLWGMV